MTEYYCSKCKTKRYSNRCVVCGSILGGEADVKFGKADESAGPGKGGFDAPSSSG